MKLRITLDPYEAKTLCEILSTNLLNQEVNFPVLTQLYHDINNLLLTDHPHCYPRMVYDKVIGTCTAGQHTGKQMKLVLYKYNDKLTQFVVEVDGKFQGQEILDHEQAVARFNKVCKIINPTVKKN